MGSFVNFGFRTLLYISEFLNRTFKIQTTELSEKEPIDGSYEHSNLNLQTYRCDHFKGNVTIGKIMWYMKIHVLKSLNQFYAN